MSKGKLAKRNLHDDDADASNGAILLRTLVRSGDRFRTLNNNDTAASVVAPVVGTGSSSKTYDRVMSILQNKEQWRRLRRSMSDGQHGIGFTHLSLQANLGMLIEENVRDNDSESWTGCKPLLRDFSTKESSSVQISL